MASILLDTGALVALLDRSEKNHARFVEFFSSFKGNLYTTEPVLTEALYLLGPSARMQRTCIQFILEGGAALVPQSSASLERAAALMMKYEDTPMDFADATLVYLAKRESLSVILTVDHADFATYRIEGKRQFRILPANRS